MKVRVASGGREETELKAALGRPGSRPDSIFGNDEFGGSHDAGVSCPLKADCADDTACFEGMFMGMALAVAATYVPLRGRRSLTEGAAAYLFGRRRMGSSATARSARACPAAHVAHQAYDCNARGRDELRLRLVFVARVRRHYENSWRVHEGLLSKAKLGSRGAALRPSPAGTRAKGGSSTAFIVQYYRSMEVPGSVELAAGAAIHPVFSPPGMPALKLRIATSLSEP
jgi:hypothetical protein